MKKFKKIAWSFTIILMLLLTWYLIDRFSYANELAYYQVNAKKDSVLTIGLVGDSWVAVKKLDTAIHNTLLAESVTNKIFSSGEPGAKTKEIYLNLFKNNSDINSSKSVIENHPDYCILVAGVNDAVGQLGKKFYAHHVVMILKTMLHYKIKPVVVEVPEFGIEEATDEMNLLKKEMYKMYAYFTNAGQLDNILSYREELKKEILEAKLTDSIIYIDFNAVCTDFKQCTDLYTGTSHLSWPGNIKLGKVIAEKIISSPLK